MTKPTLLLHIGTEKTGTTSIQEFLAHNRRRLQQAGILYPSSLGDKNHIKLAAYAELRPWSFGNKNLGINSAEKHAEFCLRLEQHLSDELKRHDYRSAIISNEHLHSNVTSIGQIETIKALLERYFSDIKVLVYFRRQDLMAVSLYSTALLVGFTPAQHLDVGAARNYYYRFDTIYDNWAEVFGSNNIIVKPFAREKLLAGNVVLDFCATAKLTPELGLAMTERKNESLSLEAACLILELNERIKDGRLELPEPAARKRNQLTQKITELFKGGTYYPNRQLAMRFFQACSETNNALQERIGVDLFNDDFSMYPEQENVELFAAKRLWAKTALDSFDLHTPAP
ncbi:hypothetical protein [Methylovulum psychrotolerans]|uniref:Sulfotransferase domain-containing protein n=1 Tax=Methylovulum psychrotolerans TaxID=1704499 RepID=A0A1Z4BWC5_9GAMM|nr:hypothetical protein [Methylovulum psychrotolerans]ASF45581.1 hypothetical protein CEK71_05575 [Methylovulum psychrotolerans]MBT9098532.1 hypothetical protein [Methylovulum psychrotolerans]POZ52870.1 hypothetical protein AADEFJLK_01480 [Methylovulum psychrotolerans]